MLLCSALPEEKKNKPSNFNSPNIQVTLQVPAACLEDHSSDLISFTICCWQRSLTPWPLRKKNSCNNLMSQQHGTGSWNSIGAISGLSRAVTPMKEFSLGGEGNFVRRKILSLFTFNRTPGQWRLIALRNELCYIDWRVLLALGKETTINKPVHTSAMCFKDYEKSQAL